jgi:ribonuclease R
VDLNLPEAKVILDSKGEPEKIVRYPRWRSHRLIEEFMVAANEAVAKHLARKGIPLIQRVHEPPDPADIEELRAFLAEIDLTLGGGETPLPKNYQDLLESIAGTPQETSVSRSCLLSMRQANYSAEKGGHFALNLNYYCHFTSPIRRYPDLEVHRILKLAQSGQKQTKRREELEAVALHSSERERAAVDAERASVSYYGARWISKHIGEEMDGTVNGVIESGIFIQLKESLVEGFLPFHKAGPSARDLKLGDPLRVRVAGAEPERGRVDFEIAGEARVFGAKIADKFSQRSSERPSQKPGQRPGQRPSQKPHQKSGHEPHRGKRRR